MAKVNTYSDFAENDYKFLEDAYKTGLKANHMCSMAQEICEKYIKHIINEYVNSSCKISQTEFEYEKQATLKTHNLNKLINFMQEYGNYNYSEEIKNAILSINGFYFSTRYPGDDSFMASNSDIERAYKAACLCRGETFLLEQQFLNHKESEIENVKENNTSYPNTDEDIDF